MAQTYSETYIKSFAIAKAAQYKYQGDIVLDEHDLLILADKDNLAVFNFAFDDALMELQVNTPRLAKKMLQMKLYDTRLVSLTFPDWFLFLVWLLVLFFGILLIPDWHFITSALAAAADQAKQKIHLTY